MCHANSKLLLIDTAPMQRQMITEIKNYFDNGSRNEPAMGQREKHVINRDAV